MVEIDFELGQCVACRSKAVLPLRRCLSSMQLFLCDKCCTLVENSRDRGGLTQK
jgi:hypothetical protein